MYLPTTQNQSSHVMVPLLPNNLVQLDVHDPSSTRWRSAGSCSLSSSQHAALRQRHPHDTTDLRLGERLFEMRWRV